jgi:hypothetical protein
LWGGGLALATARLKKTDAGKPVRGEVWQAAGSEAQVLVSLPVLLNAA